MVSSIGIFQSQFNISHLFAHSLEVISFLNKLEPICLHSTTAMVSTQLNGFKYCYLTIIILVNINLLFVYREVIKSIITLY